MRSMTAMAFCAGVAVLGTVVVCVAQPLWPVGFLLVGLGLGAGAAVRGYAWADEVAAALKKARPKLGPTSEAVATGVLPAIPPGTPVRHQKGGRYRFVKWGIDATNQVYVAHYENVDGTYDDPFTRAVPDFLERFTVEEAEHAPLVSPTARGG